MIQMGGSSLIPSHVLRSLTDRAQEKRIQAAFEITCIVKQLNDFGDHEKIAAIINLLINEFISSPEPNRQMAGLLGLAAVTHGLRRDEDELDSVGLQHLEKIVPPVLNAFSDRDSRLRYHACEALYNIAKVAKGNLIVFFNEIFNALCKLSSDSDVTVQSAAHLLDTSIKDTVSDSDLFSIEEFIRLLIQRMSVLNPFVRQFLLSWIEVVNSSPEIDMLGYLPDILEGLFNMLSDSKCEVQDNAALILSDFLQQSENSSSVDFVRIAQILVQKAASPDEYTRLTVITWINSFVKLGGEKLVPYYADILEVILPGISDKDERIRLVARQTNEDIHAIGFSRAEGLDIGAILSVVKRLLSYDCEATRIQALNWISTFLAKNRPEVLSFQDDLFDTLLMVLSDPSTKVLLLVLELHACIAKDPQHFNRLIFSLVHEFRVNNLLLKNRGSLIISHLCLLLDAERVYRELAAVLEGEEDLDFASIMVQALNLILLTSSELFSLRALLKQSMVDDAGKDLFFSLYATWCHSSVATISLCLLAQAYQHATCLIQVLVEEDFNFNFIIQLDKIIRLLETPSFVHLRLQLLEPQRYAWLVKALHGVLMLLPQQSDAFRILQTRLCTIPTNVFNGKQSEQIFSSDLHLEILHHRLSELQISEGGEKSHSINFAAFLQKFEHMQHRHHVHFRTQLSSRRSTSSTSSQDVQRLKEPNQTSHVEELSKPLSRSS